MTQVSQQNSDCPNPTQAQRDHKALLQLLPHKTLKNPFTSADNLHVEEQVSRTVDPDLATPTLFSIPRDSTQFHIGRYAMLEKLFETPTFTTARGALDGISARHGAISDNIANVNTPGYKRKRVDFEDALRKHVERRENPCGGALCPSEPFSPITTRDAGTVGRADGNNVDIEREMVELADNSLRFEVLSQFVGGSFSGLKSAINGGR